MADKSESKNNSYGVDMSVEEWRTVVGFPDYQVSNWGRVKSLARYVDTKRGGKKFVPERILLGRNPDTIVYVTLAKPYTHEVKGKSWVVPVGKLVLHTFGILPEKGQKICAHTDMNTANNRLDNIRWADVGEKIKYRNHWQSSGTRAVPVVITHDTIDVIKDMVAQKRKRYCAVARHVDVNPDTTKHLAWGVIKWFTLDYASLPDSVRTQHGVDLFSFLPTETWKEVPDFPDYAVSSLGRVVEVDWATAMRFENHLAYACRLLGEKTDGAGYKFASLWLGTPGEAKACHLRPVHTLIATAFLGPRPSSDIDVRHLDGNPSNNVLTNLAYGTRKENTHDRIVHGTMLRGETSPVSKLTEKQVVEIREKHATKGISRCQLAKEYGVVHQTISHIVKYTTWAHVYVEAAPPPPAKEPKIVPECSIDFARVWEEWSYEPDKLEKWKDIPGYEGYYQASNSGKVRSVDHYVINRPDGTGYIRKGKILSSALTNSHLYVVLTTPKYDPNYKPNKMYAVHRCVTAAFAGPCPPGYLVRHVNGNGIDNRIENLCYGTHKDNSADSIRHGSLHQKLTAKDIADIRALCAEQDKLPRKERITHRSIAKKYGVCTATISSVVSLKSNYRRT
jgi:hypothetical protein